MELNLELRIKRRKKQRRKNDGEMDSSSDSESKGNFLGVKNKFFPQDVLSGAWSRNESDYPDIKLKEQSVPYYALGMVLTLLKIEDDSDNDNELGGVS